MKILNWPAIQNPRPPKKWWDLWVKRMKKQYPRLGKVRIAEIVGRIWSNIHPKTRLKLRVYYAAAKSNPLWNPGAEWHHERFNTASILSRDHKLPKDTRDIAAGMAEEAMVSEIESKQLGMPNPHFGQLRRWYYRLPGQPYAYGPTMQTYSSKRAARAGITKAWGKLPRGTELWPDGSSKLNPLGTASRWYFKFRADAYALGPTTQRFTNERAARAYIAKTWGTDGRLPRGTEVWRANDNEYFGTYPRNPLMSNPKNLKYNWRQMPSVKEGGKRFFYIADTPDGVRKVIWNRNSRKWTVYGEQTAPSGEAPVYGRFNSPIEAMEFVEGKANPMSNPAIPRDWWNATYKEVATHSPHLDEKAISAITASIWWDKVAQARVNAVIRNRRK